jgi:alpha-1,6-mannosyltransferase
VLLGLAVAVWARWKLDASDPAAWSWPMAAALLCAPVIYPWYLLYLTPFLFSTSTLPLLVWTFTAPLAYVVWYYPVYRQPWVVPNAAMIAEYGAPALTALASAFRRRLGRSLSRSVLATDKTSV